jgi:nucleotide-binding universal stress UspA family protein
MSRKDVLVYVDNDPACPTRLEVAVALALAHDAHLTGLHVMVPPVVPGYVDVMLPAEAHELMARRLQGRAQAAEARFSTEARRAGRLRETVLDGATRHRLRYMTVPVFMPH